MPYKVLVVDDEEPVRKLFTDLLKRENFTVKTVSSGKNAYEIIGNEDFDIVLLDIKLPGESGVDILKKLKEMRPGLTVIMLTAYGYDEDLIAKTKELGCSGYIGKNMPISQIVSNIKLFIKSAKERTEE